MVPAEVDVVGGVAGVKGEHGRGVAHKFGDHLGIETHPRRVGIDIRSLPAEKPPGLEVQHVHPDVAQHLQGRLVDGLEPVVGNGPDRLPGEPRLAELDLGVVGAAIGDAGAAPARPVVQPLREARFRHRDAHPTIGGYSCGQAVAGVHMPDDAGGRIVEKHALQFLGPQIGAVGQAHLAGMDRAADPYPSAVMDADPGCPGCGVDQRVEEGPVGDGVAAVAMSSVSR